MFFNKKEEPEVKEPPKEKPTPTYLREDYPYKAVGDAITNMDDLEPSELYEIKCHACEMSIRTQGQNIRDMLDRLRDRGCLGCGNKDLVVKRVDMSAAPAPAV